MMCEKYLPDMYFIIMDFSLDMVLMKMVNSKLGHIKEQRTQKNKLIEFEKNLKLDGYKRHLGNLKCFFIYRKFNRSR